MLLTACQVKPGIEETRTLNAAEVKALFSGKTVEAYNLFTGSTSFIYYNPNGELVHERYWTKKDGRWEVNENGEICLQLDDKAAKCRTIVLKNGRYYKERPNGNGGHEMVIRYRQFIPGNELKPQDI